MQHIVVSEVTNDPYCDSNVRDGTETYATDLIFI